MCACACAHACARACACACVPGSLFRGRGGFCLPLTDANRSGGQVTVAGVYKAMPGLRGVMLCGCRQERVGLLGEALKALQQRAERCALDTKPQPYQVVMDVMRSSCLWLLMPGVLTLSMSGATQSLDSVEIGRMT